MAFGLVFLQRTGVVLQSQFTPAGPAAWVLDVPASVVAADLKEACLFLAADAHLSPDQALSLYVSADGVDFLYRGSISGARPSDVFALRWPGGDVSGSSGGVGAPAALPQGSGQGAAPGVGGVQRPRVGVSLEPLVEAAQKEGERLGSREDFAKRVAMDLFRFLESFAGDQGQMAIPARFLDAWFEKFTRRFRADPDYLTRRHEPV